MNFSRTSTRSNLFFYLLVSAFCCILSLVALILVWFGVAEYSGHGAKIFGFVVVQILLAFLLLAPIVLNVATLLLASGPRTVATALAAVFLSCSVSGASFMHSYNALKTTVQCVDNDQEGCQYPEVFAAGFSVLTDCK